MDYLALSNKRKMRQRLTERKECPEYFEMRHFEKFKKDVAEELEEKGAMGSVLASREIK